MNHRGNEAPGRSFVSEITRGGLIGAGLAAGALVAYRFVQTVRLNRSLAWLDGAGLSGGTSTETPSSIRKDLRQPVELAIIKTLERNATPSFRDHRLYNTLLGNRAVLLGVDATDLLDAKSRLGAASDGGVDAIRYEDAKGGWSVPIVVEEGFQEVSHPEHSATHPGQPFVAVALEIGSAKRAVAGYMAGDKFIPRQTQVLDMIASERLPELYPDISMTGTGPVR